MKSNKLWATALALVLLAGAIAILGATNPDTFGKFAGATGLLTSGALIITGLALRRKGGEPSVD
ncbi:hypothetical protein JYT71_00375 [Acidimicrobiaceae bacterium AH-315-P05]|nr:hypothetical protein [Acidimicrobiaceae bacterium AH-315-P05]